MKKRIKAMIAIGLTFATILGCSVTTLAAPTDAADPDTDSEKMSLVIENGEAKEELCAEHIAIEKYDNVIDYSKAAHRVDKENSKYAPDSYNPEEGLFISNCVIMRVNEDASFTADAEHIVTVINNTGHNSFYIQYDSEEAAKAAVKVLDELEEVKYAAQNVRISFDEPTNPGNSPYEDVSVNDWFYPAIKSLFYKGVIKEDPMNRLFNPDVVMSRAHFATILYRIEGEPATTYENRFPDVPDDTFYTNAVMWASGKDVGVISGYADKTFGPADDITREQMAVMMYRYAEYKGFSVSAESGLRGFPDKDKVSEFAEKEMKWAVGSGLIKGDNGLLNPQGTTSRAVGATIINRFLTNYSEE